MKCKYCQAELESNSSVCPACGKDNLKDDLKGLKITALVLVCTVMLVLLAGMICYGVTGSFLPNFGGNDATDPSETVSKGHQVSTSTGLVTMTDEELKAQMDTVVATMGEHQLTNRQLQLYYWMSVYSYAENADLTKPLSQQVYDETTGQTYEQFCMEKALDAWQETMLLADEAKKAGFELPEDIKKELEGLKAQLEYYVYIYANYYGYPLENVDDFIQMQFGPGCDFQTYYDYCSASYLGSTYWRDMLMGLDVTEAEIEAYFTANEKSLAEDYAIPVTKDFGNLVDMRILTVNLLTKKVTGSDGKETTLEDWDGTLAAVQALYDQYMAGETTQEAFAELVKKHSDDEATASNGGQYADLYAGCLSYVDVRHILIFPEGATAETVTTQEWPEKAWAVAYSQAEQILNNWLAGEKTEESFAALANAHSDDNGGKVTNGGLYTDVARGEMVKNFEDWCFDASRKEGDYGIVKTEYGYHIMYFVRSDRAVDDWAFDESRKTGDVTFIKTDTGYAMVYFVTSEPAWLRYSRYGAQAEKAGEMLKELAGKNAYTLDETKVALAEMDS